MAQGPGTATSATPRWRPPADVPSAHRLALERLTGLPAPLCELLHRRGFLADEDTERFLHPHLDHLPPPGLLPDMDAATGRIRRALARGERILVHGDYDVDGMTGTAVLTGALRDLGGEPIPFVPHRMRDGYDLGSAGIEVAAARRATLIVTTDCGISAHDAVREAAARGIDVIVTDHHRPGPTLPDAVAVVNPGRSDHEYPYRGLAGVGVAFKLVQELFAGQGLEEGRLNRYLDLVALGTIADQAPLTGENRVLARFGLRVLHRTRRVGLRALMREAGVGRWAAVRATDLAFRVAPRLNSAGRMGDAADGLRLLLTEDPDEADRLARRIELHNEDRREADRTILREARELLAETYDPARDRIVVLWREGWHPGVLGIAASRLVDELHRPVALISVDGDRGRGSARSVRDFHLFRALESCADVFERFGGHAMAAGFDVRRDRLGALRARLSEVALEWLDPTGLEPELPIDLDIRLADLDAHFLRGFSRLEPFGAEHRMPVLLARGVELRSPRTVGTTAAHLRCALADGGDRLEAIGFGLGSGPAQVTGRDRFDVVFELHVETTRRGMRPQAHVRALRPAE